MKISLVKKGVIALFFVSVLLILLVNQVHALGTPIKISTSSNATVFPQIVTDSNGYLHLIWMEIASDDAPWTGQNPGILYSRWNGDTWSAPSKISENTGFAEIPSLAVDSAKTVHVVWDDETYGSRSSPRVAYRTRASGGTWSSIETLPLPSGTVFNWSARVAIDQANAPHVVFSAPPPAVVGGSIYWTKKEGAWTTPELLSQDASGNTLNDCQWSDLRQNQTGSAIHLIYWCWNTGVWYRSYSAGAWSTPFPVVSSGSVEFTRMAVIPSGEVFVAWFSAEDYGVHVRWTQGGSWQPETTLTNLGYHSFWGFPIMGITTDSKNRTHVGWGERDSSDGLIDLRYRTFQSGAWGPVQDVDLNNNDADSPFVYPDLWDNQHFAWTEKNPSTNQWEIMYRVAEGTIQTIGSAGGTITANPNNITYTTLTIPSGALSTNTEIGVQIGPVPENVDPTQVTIPRAFTFRPHGLVFNGSATTTIYYNDTEIGGADERELKPWIWNSQTNQWEARTGTVNRTLNRISVGLTGFSLYGLSAPLVKTTWIAPTSGETLKQAAKLFEFTLQYTNGSEIVPPQTPEELAVKVKDKDNNLKQTLLFQPNGIIKDEGKKTYKATLQFQKDNYANGEYTLEIYLADSLVGSQTFTLAR